MSSLLRVKNLSIEYFHGNQITPAVRNVSFSLGKGETLGLVGKSGCGKSTLALALLGLLPPEEARITQGEILFQDKNLAQFKSAEWRSLRGKFISMIFQDPFSSLNPVFTINTQIQNCLSLDGQPPNPEKAIDLLKKVQLKDPERILNAYPHQLSGGQRQRVMTACALARDPEILIADEPTTALDVTVQAEIMDLLKDLQKTMHMSMLFITHNMGLVKNISQQLAVMFKGEIVEQGHTHQILKQPQHRYTQGLLSCVPTLTPHSGPIPVLDEEFMEG